MKPNMLMNAHVNRSHTSPRRRSLVSNGFCVGRTTLFRSLTASTAMKVMTKAIIALTRSDQWKEILSIIAFVDSEKRIPPTPVPAVVIPLAKLRLLENHCDRIAMLGM